MSHPLSHTIRTALDATTKRTITLQELLELAGEHGSLLLCAMLTLPFLLPVSIPGVSTVFGLAIILISVGLTLDRAPWLPNKIVARPIDAERLIPVLRKSLAFVERIERVIRPRLVFLTARRATLRVHGMILILGGVLLMFPLGFVPLSNTLPAMGILFLAIGISQRDGIVVLAGYGLTLVTIAYFSGLAYGAFSAGRSLASIIGG